MISARSRHLLLFGMAAATVLAVIFAPSPDETVEPMHAAASRQRATPDDDARAAAQAALTPIARTELKSEPRELFQVNKPPPASAGQAWLTLPPPAAPPLPYIYMGRMIENGELTVFLTREDKPYVVHAGDVLDTQYRVDAIRPPLIEMTYLPLKQKQLLNIGASK